jgi:hypothetical protein
MEDDFVVHRAAINRMRMTNERSMRGVFCAGVEQRLKAACSAFEKKGADCAGGLGHEAEGSG